MNNEILKLAKRHQDALIRERNELIGFEFSCASIEAFYRAAYNAGLERAAEAVEEGTALTAFQSKDCYSYAYNRAAAIRTLKSEGK